MTKYQEKEKHVLDVERVSLCQNIRIEEPVAKWNKKRPLLKKNNNYKMIKKIYQERKGIYKLANHKIKCDKMNKPNLIGKIISLYEQQ